MTLTDISCKIMPNAQYHITIRPKYRNEATYLTSSTSRGASTKVVCTPKHDFVCHFPVLQILPPVF